MSLNLTKYVLIEFKNKLDKTPNFYETLLYSLKLYKIQNAFGAFKVKPFLSGIKKTKISLNKFSKNLTL